jgi:hypothetical protein
MSEELIRFFDALSMALDLQSRMAENYPDEKAVGVHDVLRRMGLALRDAVNSADQSS